MSTRSINPVKGKYKVRNWKEYSSNSGQPHQNTREKVMNYEL
jgi:hypothetical protein